MIFTLKGVRNYKILVVLVDAIKASIGFNKGNIHITIRERIQTNTFLAQNTFITKTFLHFSQGMNLLRYKLDSNINL